MEKTCESGDIESLMVLIHRFEQEFEKFKIEVRAENI
jgi:hypothetical protein